MKRCGRQLKIQINVSYRDLYNPKMYKLHKPITWLINLFSDNIDQCN